MISSACPAVLRLIQTKYPELICHVVPALAPAEAAAIYVRRETMKRLNLVPEDVGIWFPFSLSREGHEYPSVGGCSSRPATALLHWHPFMDLFPLSSVRSGKKKMNCPKLSWEPAMNCFGAPSEENCFLRDAVMDSA